MGCAFAVGLLLVFSANAEETIVAQSGFNNSAGIVDPEPFTPEPCETYSKEDIDYWAAVLRRVCEEAYEDPEVVRTAPHNSTISRIDSSPFDDPEKWAMTWRAYVRKME